MDARFLGMPRPTLLIHGGAGNILRQSMSSEREQAHNAGLLAALSAGRTELENGGSAMHSVLAAVASMEDNPLFNAGKGAVFTAEGGHEMDASVMDGRTRQGGAVASVKGIRHPVHLAHAVLEHSPHVFLAGSGAEAFARERGLEFMPESWFDDPLRRRQWEKLRGTGTAALDHSVLIEDNQDPHKAPSRGKEGLPEQADPEATDDHRFGTVGAVALDAEGNLAAATSTGGMTNKGWGRIGDSPVLGAGTWADNRSCAVSCTGAGEFFLRAAVAHDVAARMRYGGQSLEDAARASIHESAAGLGGHGGLIALDGEGRWSFPFNTPGMYRGGWRQGTPAWTGMYGA